MKKISGPFTVTAPNAWGQDSTATHTNYEVEETDVGVTRQNLGGYQHASYTFRRSDVGRVLSVGTDGTGWTCWTFGEFKPK